MLHSPAVGSALQAVGAAVRYRSVLSDRVRELAILAVAAHWNSDFELYAHVPLARHAGLTEAEVAGLVAGAEVPFEDPAERVVLRVVRALLHDLRPDRRGVRGRARRDRRAGPGRTDDTGRVLRHARPPAARLPGGGAHGLTPLESRPSRACAILCCDEGLSRSIYCYDEYRVL